MQRLSMVALVGLATLSASCGGSDGPRADETSAIVSLKAIAVAQTAYRTVCGKGGYAATLLVLGAPPGGGSGDGFIESALGASLTPQKSGYTFTMTAGAGSAAGPADCNGTPTVTAFYATAVPWTPAKGTGPTRAFAINQLALVWQSFSGVAPTEPFRPPAIPVQ